MAPKKTPGRDAMVSQLGQVQPTSKKQAIMAAKTVISSCPDDYAMLLDMLGITDMIREDDKGVSG